MNRIEKQGGIQIKYNSPAGLYPSSRAMDWRRGGLGLPELMLTGQDLAHHSLLADHEEEEDGLARRFVLSQGLASLDGLMVRKETDNIKQEFKLSDAVMQIKKEGNELADFQEKKKRKQHPPAKNLTINEDGSLCLQSTRPHVCEHCSATFRTSYHLQRHAFIHTGEKPFQCSQCDMRFIQKYLLQRHEKIHTGEKPFRCDECGMKFIQKYHMERHRRTHSGEKPYQCCHCQQHFSRTDRVLKHQRLCLENRKTNKINSKDELAISEQDLAYSSLPKDFSQPKKKRHKANEIPQLPVNLLPKVERGERREEVGPLRRECQSLYSHTSKVKNEYELTEYSVELPDLSVGGSCLPELPTSEVNHYRKLLLKKPPCKKSQRKPTGPQDDLSSPLSSFDDGKVNRYTFQLVDKPGFPSHTDPMTVDPHQGAPRKPAASSTNYDDAMQFLKKKRYLQPGVPSSGRDHALNMAIDAQASANRSTGARISSDVATTCVSDCPTMKTEIKPIQDKNILSDEVLQTLLDHYSNKASGQPEVSFGVAGTEATPSVSVNSSYICADSHVKALGMNAQAPPSGNASMLQEYSKFLQQALERTSQNDSYLNTQSLPFVTKSQSLSSPPKLSAAEAHYTSSGRLRPELTSSVRLSSEKSHFGLLVGDSQHSFSFSGEETNPSSVSSTEDFLEQVTPPKNSHSPAINPLFQMGHFEQNFHSHFHGSGSGVSSLFSFSNGAMNLHGHEGGTDFSEYPLANMADGRTRPTSSLDSTGSQTYS